MKPKFTSCLFRPLLASMIQEPTAASAIARIRNSIFDGADVIALHMEFLDKEYQTRGDLKRIFAYAGSKPVYTMNYRSINRPNVNDEELVKVQLIAAEAGASMVDVMGDIFNPSLWQLATDQATVDKQRWMVDEFHKRDCEVMFSSHTWKYMTAEETLEHCHLLIERGADMVKIAMCAFTDDQMDEVYRTTRMMKRELTVPFLHVCMGQYGKLHRIIAPLMGSAMALCIQEYIPVCNKEQPILRAARVVLNNIDWELARDDRLGSYEFMPDEE